MQLPGAGSDGLMLETLWDTAAGSSWDGGACGEVYYKDKTARQAEEVKKPAWNSSANTKVGEEKGRGDVHPTACGVSRAGADGYSWRTLSPWEWSHTGAGARVKEPQRGCVTDWPQPPLPIPSCSQERRYRRVENERMKLTGSFPGKNKDAEKSLFQMVFFVCVAGWASGHLSKVSQPQSGTQKTG